MRLINKDTDYSIKALLRLAGQDRGRASAIDLARDLKIPYAFLRRILQIMSANGIVKSVKGRGGGFILARSPDKIYLTELIRILQGPVKLAECILDPRACAGVRTCRLRKKIMKIQAGVVAELEAITLASLNEK